MKTDIPVRPFCQPCIRLDQSLFQHLNVKKNESLLKGKLVKLEMISTKAFCCTDRGLKEETRDVLPTDQSSRNSILKIILLSKQGYNTRKYGTTLQFAFTVL